MKLQRRLAAPQVGGAGEVEERAGLLPVLHHREAAGSKWNETLSKKPWRGAAVSIYDSFGPG